MVHSRYDNFITVAKLKKEHIASNSIDLLEERLFIKNKIGLFCGKR